MVRGEKAYTFIEVIIITLVLGLLAGSFAVPAYVKALKDGQKTGCLSNIYAVEDAKDRYFLTRPGLTEVTLTDLAPFLIRGEMPVCPAGGEGSYQVNTNAEGEAVLARDALLICTTCQHQTEE